MKKNNQHWNIENTYLKLPFKFYSKQLPEMINFLTLVCFVKLFKNIYEFL